ncbi:MAG: hypothetical protein H6741_29145 [Alphaproteobacteria bacterium]|nr:hypothetical protein [Alphaproteobacteria bacterium]MCB9796786.1 hypothetical protein [Alphaproteobacteria bacterium]
MIALLLLACSNNYAIDGSFNGPDGVAILHPGDGGPFYEPVALVANSRSGRIVPLDLKHGQVLADDPAAPFLRASPLATGADRILGEMVVWAPDVETVTAYVADARTRSLLEVPWIIGVDANGAPIELEASLGEEGPQFIDADGSGDSVEVLDLTLRPRGATSEFWTFTFDGAAFQVEGSRSGRQSRELLLHQPWVSDDGGLNVLLSGTATQGDQVVVEVDRGIREFGLGGWIEGLKALPQAGVILASVYDPDLESGKVVVFDPAEGVVRGELPLDVSAHPGRMASDLSEDVIYITDLDASVAYEVLLDAADPLASAVRALEMPAPLVDLAWQGDADYEHLFVAPAGENGYRLYDLAGDAWVDLNPFTPEVDGMDLRAPVTGMATGLDPVQLPELGDQGQRGYQRVVAVATFEGALFVVEGGTGCLARDELGPYATADSDSPFVDEGTASNPSMWEDNVWGRGVQVNGCGGLARDDLWSATFDEAKGSWLVESNLDGIQETRAYEDERYISDEGQVSFVIRAGSAPSTEGDQFRFRVYDGVAKVSGDLSGDNVIGSGEVAYSLPTRPVPYSYLAGPTGGGWDPVNRKVGVVLPLQNSDLVLRVNLESVTSEYVTWN